MNAVGSHAHSVGTGRLVEAEPGGEVVLAVGSSTFRHLCAHEGRQRGGHVDERTEGVRCFAFTDGAGPIDDEGHSATCFIGTVLAASEGTARLVVARKFFGTVGIAVVEDGAVV